MSTNKHIKNQLIDKYGSQCMAGGVITKSNILTMHHIVRRFDGGKTNIYNGSLIAHLEHSGIHILSDRSIVKGNAIKDYLRYYKEFRDDLAKLQFHMWLESEVNKCGFEEYYTKDKLLIYKRSGR